ncbi:UDP-N-acetylmuramoyl-tripeptide--D-alanyl-D-alanine ligase [Roseicyclus mahoneyensis]|uniref:UDP-N-acetylmuramoyl-tripeptide--D-alanyl-D-alanine ligase n=1 Tax=Roseicyclus mahoneyensis TaxID=164332 RepID=A0A316GHT1_9RHOB|nr:UDP-N-acetylmuramoyl-tripeptide--D-alanyl-D-alanine ligase [Roseicyclus mahoneyensis]PWK60521.1 UDP-N-acetylmuramoyl-tripeptide--D-alanyl-D-alanine ligase [Roseicyclus mahoneyensis]
MTVLWTAADAAAATGGQIAGYWQAKGICIDSRSVAKGDLFVALSAARDGHDFVADALARGAVAALVARIPEGVDPARLLIVADVMDGLRALGAAGRARTQARVIAVTGSVGKTTVKEMLRAALSPQGRTHAAEASFNNHWGVPITLARMPADTEYAVIEIGMNHPGEIAPLARLARPHVAIVTTVAPAHLEAFGVIEGIAHEKAAIFEGLEPGGTALAHADIGTAAILFDKAKACGATLIRFGVTEGVEARLVEAQVAEAATVIRAEILGTDRLLRIGAPGRHYAMNALIALTAAKVAGADATQAALALSGWTPFQGRGTREKITLSAADDLVIEMIDDAFNANPASIAAALDMLAASEPQGRGRRIAVLGDMLELGPTGPALHAAIAEHPAMARIATVHTVGPLMEHLYAALPGALRGQHASSAEEMAANLPQTLRSGDVLLIKGSKGIKVARVVDALRKLGQSAAYQGQGPR